MFDFDLGKILLIGVVALIFIPPKDLPEALRTLGRLVGKARRMASEFQSQFTEALRESELSQLRDDLHDLKQRSSVEGALTRVADMLEAPAADAVKAAAAEPAPPAQAVVPDPSPVPAAASPAPEPASQAVGKSS